MGKKGKKKKKNSINYLIRNLELHTISQRELRSELVIYFWYISGRRRCSQYWWFSVEAGFNLCNGITESVGPCFSTARSKIPPACLLLNSNSNKQANGAARRNRKDASVSPPVAC